ncbi:M48 family metallopeptidase [Enterovibrio norvegicus]|nr:M48 family metallopeptidase [Enterovibrio norvegicus]
MTEGYAYPPQQSSRMRATLTILGETRAVLQYEDHRIDCRLEEITCTEKVGSIPIKLRFPDGDLFIPDNESALPAYFLHSQKSGLSWLESSKLAILSCVFIAVLLIGAFFYVGLPSMSKGIVTLLPEEVPVAVGEHVLSQLDERLLKPSELPTSQRTHIQAEFDRLVADLPSMPVLPRLVFRSWERGPNAFALSDGTVILMDSLVAIADNDRQLNAILLHELGHVYYQHVMTSLVQSTLVSVSVAVITGESTGVIDTLTGLGVLFVTAGYSRENEEESDAFSATHLMAKYGDTTALAEMFEKLRAAHGAEMSMEWLSSHPDTNTRIEAAKQFNP